MFCFRFVSFHFVSFRFVSFRFVSFRFVSFCFVLFCFVLFCFVLLAKSASNLDICVNFIKELLQTQRFLQRKIPRFQFQIGFSGKGFKRGNDEEDDGDVALLAHASAFSWFCHMWDHEQAHKFDNLTILTNLMEKNKRFAKVRFVM